MVPNHKLMVEVARATRTANPNCPEQWHVTTPLHELMDSLQRVEMMLDLDIPDEVAEELVTFGDVVKHLESRL